MSDKSNWKNKNRDILLTGMRKVVDVLTPGTSTLKKVREKIKKIKDKK